MKLFIQVMTRKTAVLILNLIAGILKKEPVEVLADFLDDQDELNRLIRLLVGSHYPIITTPDKI